MTTPKKTPSRSRKRSTKSSQRTKGLVRGLRDRQKTFLARRPHRSFRLTRRRDYRRSLQLPGYAALTVQVWRTIWQHRWALGGLAFFYLAIMLLTSGLVSEDSYRQLRDIVSQESDNVGMARAYQTIPILFGVISSQAMQLTGDGAATAAQQVIIALLGLYTWLTVVWLLRNWMANRAVKLRDGLYSAGAPVIALLLVSLLLVVQLLPGVLGVLLYLTAQSTELLQNTGILMLFGMGCFLLIILSLYWATSTVIALIIVTIPGMYPMRAIKLAGDIVTGRRIRVLLRLSWQFVVVGLLWLVVLIPIVWLDAGLKALLPMLNWLPLVPVTLLVLATFTVIFVAVYTYMFYRKVVEDDSSPA